MAITTAMCTSFKSELLVLRSRYKYSETRSKSQPLGTYGAATTDYSNVTGNSDEASGTGYTAVPPSRVQR